MGIGVSIFLMAVGAVLAWGVNAVVPGANLFVIGIILLCVGALGLLVDLAIFAPRRGYVARRRTYRGAGPGPYPAGGEYAEDREIVDRY
jgi:hypothetical protein